MINYAYMYVYIYIYNFVSWCMLYTYEGNKIHSWENDAVLSLGEPLNHIHQDTKSARLIAVCKHRLRPVQTSNFSCAESNANEQNRLLIFTFGTWKVRRLNSRPKKPYLQALISMDIKIRRTKRTSNVILHNETFIRKHRIPHNWMQQNNTNFATF